MADELAARGSQALGTGAGACTGGLCSCFASVSAIVHLCLGNRNGWTVDAFENESDRLPLPVWYETVKRGAEVPRRSQGRGVVAFCALKTGLVCSSPLGVSC